MIQKRQGEIVSFYQVPVSMIRRNQLLVKFKKILYTGNHCTSRIILLVIPLNINNFKCPRIRWLIQTRKLTEINEMCLNWRKMPYLPNHCQIVMHTTKLMQTPILCM